MNLPGMDGHSAHNLPGAGDSTSSSDIKERILSAVARSAQRLLDAANWEAGVQDVLELLGKVSGASHAYLFQNHTDENGSLLASMKYEWINPEQGSQSDFSSFQNIPLLEEDMIDWYNILVTGQPFYDSTTDFPQEWSEKEGRGRIKTLLDVPIFVDGEWWGVIGFDDCVRVKPWSQAEVDALQIAAGLLGSAIKAKRSRDALAASEEKFQKAFKETFVAMAIGRLSDRVILDANEAFAKLTGYSREEIVNRWASELNLWQNEAEHILHHQMLKEQGFIHEFKTRLRKRNGEIGVVLVSVSSIKIDADDCLLYTIFEITRLEEALNDLQEKNNELERFTYTVSHDLKAPLITIGGFLGLLQMDIKRGDAERVEQNIRRVAEAASKMERLLNELLELSRIGRIISEPGRVSFEEIAREALTLAQGRIAAIGVEVLMEPGLPEVMVDRARIVEVVQNLLDNAAKFMGDQTKPQIRIGMRRSMDGERIFFIADNGIGIEPEYLERIFGLFNKLNANSEGTGIGLALVKRIIEYHGGRIWVESQGRGKGSTFCFTLPRVIKQ